MAHTEMMNKPVNCHGIVGYSTIISYVLITYICGSNLKK